MRNFFRLMLLVVFTVTAIDRASAMKMEKTFVQGSVKVPVWIFSPDKTDGKIPAVLLVQGSGGVNLKGRSFYAEEFAKMGIATIFFDAFTPRGVQTTIRDQSSVSPFDMADDARAILLSLKDSSKIDSDRVGIMGFSKGGGVVMTLSLQRANKPDAPKFAFYIAMYPPCDSFRYEPKIVDRPLEIMVGEKDTYNSPASCKEYAGVLFNVNGDKNIHFNEIKGAQHAWDVPGPAHVTVPGENYSRCRFNEVSPQVWYDSTMRYKIFDHGRTEERKKALNECMTHQVSWGYNKKAAEQSFGIIKEYVLRLKH